MTHREAYVFGWVYGKIDMALYSKTGRGVPGVPDPSSRPLTASALAIQAGTREGVMDGLDPQIAAAYAEITYLDDAQPEPVQPLEVQGSWQIGYYHARAGKPLDAPADPLDIEGRRRAKKLSQAKLAELVGVTQAQICKWEKGQAQPTEENRLKLMEALK